MKGLYKIILFASVFALFSSSIVYSIPVFADVDLKKGPPGTPPAIKLKQGPSKDFAPGQILVGLKHADKDFKKEIKANIGQVLDEIKENKSFLIKVPPNSEDAFIKTLQKNPKVKYAEKNFIVQALTNDSYWSYQWDMRIIDADVAWQTQTGDPSVIVAVVDTGVNYNHPDLAPRVTKGYDYAYDDEDPMDGNGHGTHVAGTVGATINNNRGVAGLAQVEIYAVKVLDDTGSGFISDVANGIMDAAAYGADVINLSLGCYCPSQTLEEAINDANEEGALVVAAAGNDNTGAILYPAGYGGAVSVSATDLNDAFTTYSNYGSTIELSAPGGDSVGGPYWETYVLSTWKNNNYVFSIGTSMAAPHISGVAALVKSEYPSLTNNQIREHLWNTSDDLGTSGWDKFFGYGRVNALTAITASPTPVNPEPTTVQVFFDDFESPVGDSGFSQWTESGESDWRIKIPDEENIPGFDEENLVAHADNCDRPCKLTVTNSIDLGSYDSATLSFWKYVDRSIDRNEYLKVKISANGGSSWTKLVSWTHGNGDDDQWHQETFDLTGYLTSDFKVKFVTKESKRGEDVAIDNVLIEGTT